MEVNPKKGVPFYLSALTGEYQARRIRNPAYSLRAYSKLLSVDSGALSQILSGKRKISYRLGVRIAERLPLDPEQQHRFIVSIGEAQKNSGLKRKSKILKVLVDQSRASSMAGMPEHQLDLQTFAVISEWYYYAVLELTQTIRFNPDPKWIAKVLDITVSQATQALEKLLAMGLLRVLRGGRVVKAHAQVMSADRTKTSAAHRLRQKQILDKASDSLMRDPIEERSHSALTMAIDPDKIPEAKKRIDFFMTELCSFLEGGPKTRVYEVALQLFPLQKKEPI